MKAAYGRKHQTRRAMDKVNSDMMSMYLGISVLTLRELWGFGYDRNFKYSENLTSMLESWFELYHERGKSNDVEVVRDVNFAARRDVRELGVNLDDIEEQYDPKNFIEIQKKYERGNPKDRCEYLKIVDESLSSLWFITMLWLHNEYEFGAIKLRRYYLKCRERLCGFYKEYLKCSNEGDAKCVEFRDGIIAECDSRGVNVL